MPELRVFPVALAGGLQDSKAQPEPQDLRQLFNFAIFRDRLALRAPIKEVATIQDDQGTPQDVTSVVGIEKHASEAYVVSHSTATDKVYLHSMDPDGSGLQLRGVVWTGISESPTISMTSFEGGTASGGTSRLYISDFNQNNATRFWDGGAMRTLTADLNNDETDEDVIFSLVAPYNFHLWGTGFFEGGAASRAELLRFSQPGLVPGTDPAGGNNPKEWWHADHRGVGRRGDRISSLSYAGGRMMVFKETETHVIFGYDASSWATIELSDTVGAVGPHASTTANTAQGRLCFFWSNDGPYISDGKSIQYIGIPIRQRVVDLEADEGTVAAFSPEDGMVYFVLKPDGETDRVRYLAFDVNNERWTEGEWLQGGGTRVPVEVTSTITSTTLPAPEGGPTNLTATATSHESIELEWTNGDVNLSSETHIYRSTTEGFTPTDSNRITIVGSGTESLEDTELDPITEYFYRVRHFRFQQFSALSNEASATTWLEAPENLTASSTPEAVELSYHQPNDLSDVEIVVERKTGSATSFTAITTLVDVAMGDRTYIDSSGTCRRAYDYRLKAQHADFHDSEYSNTATGTPCETTGAGDIVSNLTLGVFGCDGSTGVILNWDQDVSLMGTSDSITITKIYLVDGLEVSNENDWLEFTPLRVSSTGVADQDWECPGGAIQDEEEGPFGPRNGIKYTLRYFLGGTIENESHVIEEADVCGACPDEGGGSGGGGTEDPEDQT